MAETSPPERGREEGWIRGKLHKKTSPEKRQGEKGLQKGLRVKNTRYECGGWEEENGGGERSWERDRETKTERGRCCIARPYAEPCLSVTCMLAGTWNGSGTNRWEGKTTHLHCPLNCNRQFHPPVNTNICFRIWSIFQWKLKFNSPSVHQQQRDNYNRPPLHIIIIYHSCLKTEHLSADMMHHYTV